MPFHALLEFLSEIFEFPQESVSLARTHTHAHRYAHTHLTRVRLLAYCKAIDTGYHCTLELPRTSVPIQVEPRLHIYMNEIAIIHLDAISDSFWQTYEIIMKWAQ